MLALSSDVTRVWDAADNNAAPTANNNFYNNLNWDSDTRPTFSGNTDSLLFNGAGSGSTIALNITGGLTEYLVKSITFDAGTYTLNGAQHLTFGDATSSLNNTGNLTNNSPNIQTLNPAGQISFSFGTIHAAGGGFTFGTASNINIGNQSAAAGRDVKVDGAFNVTVNGELSGVGTDSSEGGALIKNGSGTLFLQRDSPLWGGRITIAEGILQINKGNALGSNDGRTTITGGDSTSRLQFTGGINVNENLYFEGRTAGSSAAHLVNVGGNNTLSAPIRLQAGGTEYRIDSNGGALTLSGNVVHDPANGPSNLTLGGSGTGIVTGKIGAGGQAISVIKDGNGMWTLTGSHDYSGSTQILGGRLNLSTSQIGGGAISLGDGTTLGLTLAAAGQTLTTSSLTIGESAGASLAFHLGAFGNPTTALVTATDLTINGSNTVQLSTGGGGLSVGQFPLIQYTNPLGGSGFAGLTLGALPPRVTAALVNDSGNHRILLDVTAFDIPVWTGSVSSDWDATDGVATGTANWKELNSGNVTTYLQGDAGTDSVLFDDTAATAIPGKANVNLTTTLTPATITVNNSALTYTFSGTGNLSGGANIVKKGDGTLILANTGGNNYTGATRIEAGTLQIGDGITSGGGSVGTGEITNNGTLIINRPDAVSIGPVIGGDGTIIKRGSGAATLSANNTYTGTVIVSAGTLKLGSSNALGSTVAGTIVETGAAIDVNGKTVPVGEVVTISGFGVLDTGALVNTGTGSAAVGLRNVVFAGDTSFGGSARWDIRDNPGGLDAKGFELVKVGSNNIFLAHIGETHLGNIHITTGRVAVEGDTTLGNQAGTVTVALGAELGLEDSTVSHTKPIRLEGGTLIATAGTGNLVASPITLVDSGTLRTNLNVTLTVSGVIGGSGNLTKTTNGTLILTGNNNYTGVTTITGGTLRVGGDTDSGSLGTGDIFLDASVGNTATLGFRRTDTGLVVANNIISIGTGGNVVNIGHTNSSLIPPSAIVTFSGNNEFDGAVNINGGSLRITNSSALGIGSKTVSIEGVNKPSLRLDGSNGSIDLAPGLSFVTSNDNATYPAILNEAGHNRIAGSIALNTGNGGHTRVVADAGSSLTLSGGIAPTSMTTSDRTLILDGAGDGSVNGIAADYTASATQRVLSLTKAGTGVWSLNAANTYTGATTIQSGTLVLGGTGSISSSARIDIAAGATLDVQAVRGFALSSNQALSGSGTILGNLVDAAGVVITPGGSAFGTLAFANDLAFNGGGTVQLQLAATNTAGDGVNDLLTVGGNLALNAATTFEIIPTAGRLASNYQLVSYSGTLSGSVANLTLAHSTRFTLTADSSTAGQINLNVTGSAQSLTWAGDNGANLWNVNSAANWNGGAEKFYHVDSVLFDDSTDSTAITITGTVIPNRVTVNGTKNYTFVGTGGIHGAPEGLTKNGSGTLTLITSNAYTGPTLVNEGELIVTGSISGSAVTVANGASIGGSGSITTNNQPFTLAAGARLSPGTGIGTFTVNTGTATFDLSEAVSVFGSGALVFELDAVGTSDKLILTGGTLNIGVGVLGFDDFSFTTFSGFGGGTYTLISSATPILGSLDANLAHLTGFIGDQTAILSIGNAGTEILLTVVPEPSTAATLIAGVGALLGTRRRRRPVS